MQRVFSGHGQRRKFHSIWSVKIRQYQYASYKLNNDEWIGSTCDNSFYLSWAHTERHREEGSEMCVTFKFFPCLLAALKPQRFPLFAWHKSSHGHPLAWTAKGRKRSEVGEKSRKSWATTIKKWKEEKLQKRKRGKEWDRDTDQISVTYTHGVDICGTFSVTRESPSCVHICFHKFNTLDSRDNAAVIKTMCTCVLANLYHLCSRSVNTNTFN